MHIVLHAGAHVTDEDRLAKCLLSNADMLASHGTAVPIPETCRLQLRDAVVAATRGPVPPETIESLYAAILPEGEADRVVLSNDSFFGTHKMAVKRMLYPAACARLEAMHQIFPNDRIELFLGLRNLAGFIPAVLAKTNFDTVGGMLRGGELSDFRWSELLERIRAQLPDLPITVWCNEDTPLIWAELVRELAGLHPMIRIEGEFSLLSEIMTEGATERLTAYTKNHPDMTELQKRRVITAFLDRFARAEAIEEEYEIEDWTETIMDQLTDIYEDDIEAIRQIPGVTLIMP